MYTHAPTNLRASKVADTLLNTFRSVNKCEQVPGALERHGTHQLSPPFSTHPPLQGENEAAKEASAAASLADGHGRLCDAVKLSFDRITSTTTVAFCNDVATEPLPPDFEEVFHKNSAYPRLDGAFAHYVQLRSKRVATALEIAAAAKSSTFSNARCCRGCINAYRSARRASSASGNTTASDNIDEEAVPSSAGGIIEGALSLFSSVAAAAAMVGLSQPEAPSIQLPLPPLPQSSSFLPESKRRRRSSSSDSSSGRQRAAFSRDTALMDWLDPRRLAASNAVPSSFPNGVVPPNVILNAARRAVYDPPPPPLLRPIP